MNKKMTAKAEAARKVAIAVPAKQQSLPDPSAMFF